GADDLAADLGDLARDVVQSIVHAEVPDRSIRDRARTHIQVRARQGVPLSSRYRGVQIAMAEIWTMLAEAVAQLDLPASVLLEPAHLIMASTRWIMEQEAKFYGDLAVEQARDDERRRAALIEGLTRGTLRSDELREDASPYGLATTHAYLPFHAGPVDGSPL